MPNNDLDAVGGDPLRVGEVRAGKRIKPYLFDAESRFLYVWNFRGSEDNESHAQTVCVMTERLYQFGRGVDMAWAWGEVLDETEANMRLNDHPGTTYRPCTSGSDLALACPQTGSLQSLLDRYSAQRQRFTTLVEGKKVQQLFSQPPKPRFEQVSYNSPATLRLYDLAGPLVPWSLAKCLKLVEYVRDAATERLTKVLPDRKDEIERVLIGREATEADKAARIRISSLPSIGHPHADRAIRRLLVQVPPNCPIRADDIAWAFSGLTLKIDTETGEILLNLVPATDLGMLRYYGVDGEHASRTWRTVTPAALPERAARRRIEPSRIREEAKGGLERGAEQNRATTAVLQALRHAQIDTRVSTVRVQREPFDAKGARAEVFAAGTRFTKERLWHIEIGFAEPVAGPLVLGDGRYMGIGLMAPVHRVEGIHCFTILDGLTNRANATVLSHALRRAVMSRVQETIGKKNFRNSFLVMR